MEEAIAAGKATAVINSGFIAEPGTGVFLADVPERDDTQDITAEVLESGVNVIPVEVKPTTCLKAPLASLAKRGYPHRRAQPD